MDIVRVIWLVFISFLLSGSLETFKITRRKSTDLILRTPGDRCGSKYDATWHNTGCQCEKYEKKTLMSTYPTGSAKCAGPKLLGCNNSYFVDKPDAMLSVNVRSRCMIIRTVNIWTADVKESGAWKDITSKIEPKFKWRGSKLNISNLEINTWKGQLLKIDFSCSICITVKFIGSIVYPYDINQLFPTPSSTMVTQSQSTTSTMMKLTTPIPTSKTKGATKVVASTKHATLPIQTTLQASNITTAADKQSSDRMFGMPVIIAIVTVSISIIAIIVVTVICWKRKSESNAQKSKELPMMKVKREKMSKHYNDPEHTFIEDNTYLTPMETRCQLQSQTPGTTFYQKECYNPVYHEFGASDLPQNKRRSTGSSVEIRRRDTILSTNSATMLIKEAPESFLTNNDICSALTSVQEHYQPLSYALDNPPANADLNSSQKNYETIANAENVNSNYTSLTQDYEPIACVQNVDATYKKLDIPQENYEQVLNSPAQENLYTDLSVTGANNEPVINICNTGIVEADVSASHGVYEPIDVKEGCINTMPSAAQSNTYETLNPLEGNYQPVLTTNEIQTYAGLNDQTNSDEPIYRDIYYGISSSSMYQGIDNLNFQNEDPVLEQQNVYCEANNMNGNERKNADDGNFYHVLNKD